ncbi:Phospholipase/lecithinase/hemolysin [Chromobacterium violaceum]|uniref:SGNH/GDSL hydrolase family protein n=1 Tax=Chromobacterium violaceum TaxID=536 RepID=UPI0009B817E5|nr:SGNH/GDSL hydrolase family protein [Chromobacterium violaceum]MBP4045020.1 SGNH/GDSL hydrolase family protein [Chromobacterium violaceum]MBT2869567.1 SGNH/GDSL hydrolase family protein [Chromobacterium violaceum]MBX9269116.1 SGNH/GDSL hydrolase family protein [Chromobacterium violaceum]QRO32002.1 SGNH/GDSL hydrolase family protein [Chromobacterium violaceum]QRQ18197.1 SGNH/GDSL hydrolase family protein [Chromobacterium violaceum]
MKSWLLLGLTLSSLAWAGNDNGAPDPRYAHVLSPSGPLSRAELLKRGLPKQQAAARVSALSVPGPATYTYVRCFYRAGGANTQPGTDYEWALDPSSGDYYRLNGNWWSSSIFDWKNMFYSDVTQDTLRSVCQQTLAKKGRPSQPAMVFAADNAMSFNYTVWTNDKAGQGSRINKIIAFGDSLSDNQNVYNASQWTLPNRNSWYIGHFSNGPVWVEYLADRLKLPMYNWAIGGAGVSTQKLVIPGVVQQVQSWQDYMKQAPNYDPATTLFTMWIGGNDLVNYGSTPDKVIAGQQQALTSLINAGGRNILLLKLPDVSRAPVFQYKGGAATVAAQVKDLNQKLDALAASLRQQYGVNIQVFDSYAMFNDLLTNPGKYQVSNTTQSCLNINADSSLNYMQTQSPRANCANADSFVFWDTLHPTTHTHLLLGNAVADFLGSAGAMPLLSKAR